LLQLTSGQEKEIISTLDEITRYLSERESLLPEATAQIEALTGTQYIGEGSLKRFIRSEIERQESVSILIPSHFEFEFGNDVNAAVNLTNGDHEQDQMLLSGIIDRIDHIGDQYFGIIDYKTGTLPEINEIVDGLSLQLPLYMHAYRLLSGRTGIYGSYIQLHGNSVTNKTRLYDRSAEAYIPYSLPRKEVSSDEIIQNTVLQVRKQIRDIRRGHFPITARKECPDMKWCPYKSICRYTGDRGSESGEYTLDLLKN
jgi:ATP-dependent helicase/DNAse subunit B